MKNVFVNWLILPFAATAVNYGVSLFAVRHVDASTAILIGSYFAVMTIAALKKG